MSFIVSLDSEWDKIREIFVKFFKNEPTWASIAETDLALIAPIINKLVTTFAGPAVDAEVSLVLTAIQNDLVLATKFIQAMDNSSNLTDVLNSLLTNLSGLLTLSAIKNSSFVAEITSDVTLVINEIQVILKNLSVAVPKA